MSAKTIMGGLLACILLGIYAFLMWLAISAALEPDCDLVCQGKHFTDKMAAALMTIGTLVSGVIIAELAITRPTQTPGVRLLDSSSSRAAIQGLKIVVYAYLAIWLVCGLTAFLVGLVKDVVHKPLLDAGNAWLGLALSAGYAFFGITPDDNRAGRKGS